MTYFQYHPDILRTFPGIVGGVLLINGLRNEPTPPDLLRDYQTQQQITLETVGETSPADIPSLAAWRSAFRPFGIDPTKYRSAAEALLRRLSKKGDIPSINLLVDIGNLVSIRYRLPVAVFDTRALQGAVTVHFADGTEPFTDLNTDQIEYPDIGEVIFSDESRKVIARRWCWRQSDDSAARHDSTDVIVTVEAHHTNALQDIQSALNDLSSLFGQYAGGTLVTALLTADNPAI